MAHEHAPPCPTCGGRGQISFFQGESRFLLTDEECPACLGLGYLPEEDTSAPHHRQPPGPEDNKD